MSIAQEIQRIQQELAPTSARLVVVTKTRSIAELQETLDAGVIDFGENRVQEMVEKQALLPANEQSQIHRPFRPPHPFHRFDEIIGRGKPTSTQKPTHHPLSPSNLHRPRRKQIWSQPR